MSLRFVDTNILLRYLVRDDENRGKQALALLRRVEQGKEKVATSSMVVFETVFTLEKRYRFPREQIKQAMLDILSLRGLELPNKGLYETVFDLYVGHNISFADAFNAAYMASREMVEIYSWDADFDKLPGVTRVEPEEAR